MKIDIFSTTLVLLSCVLLMCASTKVCNEFPPYCYQSSCHCLNQNQSVSSLWKLPKRTTPLISKFRCAIINLINEVDKNQFAILYAQTIWSVNALIDFDASISPSCVYSDMIIKSLASMKNDHTCKLKEALIDYGNLCKYATRYAIAVGLSAAGCPVEMKEYKTCSKKICTIEKSFYDFLSLNPNKFPKEIEELIICLSKSPNEDERLIALAAVASGTDISIKLFNEVLKGKELLMLIQLKSCSYDIPKVCCPLRKEELTRRSKKLRRVVDHTVKMLL